MPNSNDYNYGYKVRLNNDNVKGIAVNRIDNGEDVFRVYGDGRIEGKSLRLSQTIWADYVFKKEYKLLPLADHEFFIKKNKHLPNIPSEEEVKEEGLDMGNMDALLLEKNEEMTLYIIQLNKEIKLIKEENELIKAELKK